MPLENQQSLLDEITLFVRLQNCLVVCFVDKYQGVADWDLLTGVPRRGTLECCGESWKFMRHGRGIQFTSSVGVIDAHTNFKSHPNAIDAHRLSIFLESRSKIAEEADATYHFCETQLERMVQLGLLAPVEGFAHTFVVADPQ